MAMGRSQLGMKLEMKFGMKFGGKITVCIAIAISKVQCPVATARPIRVIASAFSEGSFETLKRSRRIGQRRIAEPRK
jgi:hypothetical protein